MDKIYSRMRIKIPKLRFIKCKENKENYFKRRKIFFVFFIAIITAFIIIGQLNPVFNAICTEKAKALATEIINQKSNDAFKDLNYDMLVNIIKDDLRKYKYVKGKYS